MVYEKEDSDIDNIYIIWEGEFQVEFKIEQENKENKE